jgi:hypothetical protein
MLEKLESIFVKGNGISFDKFKRDVKGMGFEYVIECYPLDEEEDEAIWACMGKEELTNLCLLIAHTHMYRVESINLDLLSCNLN